jgi:hypothetical protein
MFMAFDLNAFIDQHVSVVEERPLFRVRFEKKLMITGNHHFMTVRKLPEPLVEVLYCGHTLAKHCEVTYADENVSCGDIHFTMKFVRIAKQDKNHSPPLQGAE